jgi:hypothetical protein
MLLPDSCAVSILGAITHATTPETVDPFRLETG